MAESESMPGRAKATSLLIVVFLIGAVCGAAVWVLAEHAMHGHVPPHAVAPRPPFERIARQLDLDREQRMQVRRILERNRLKVHEALEEAHAEIRELLRPDQRERFDAMRPRRREPRFRRRPPRPGGGQGD